MIDLLGAVTHDIIEHYGLIHVDTNELLNSLEMKYRKCIQIKENQWLSIDINTRSPGKTIPVDSIEKASGTISVARCGGGAYNYFCGITVDLDRVVLKVRTECGIMNHKQGDDEHIFEYSDPGFPNDLYDFIEERSAFIHDCYDRERDQYWESYYTRRDGRVAECTGLENQST